VLRRPLTALLAAAALTGCGGHSAITGGGQVPSNEPLTVYVLMPRTPEGADVIRGAKLALSEAGGRVGKRTVQFSSATEPDEEEGIASTVRDVVLDTGTIAVIGDLDARTAAVSAPLLNAVGLLHVSPVSPLPVAQPSALRTLFALGPSADDQAAAIVAQARGPIAVEAEPGGAALADAIRVRAGRTVTTERARTVVYAGSDPVNARGVVRSVLKENRRAEIVLPARLAALDTGPRIGVLAADAPVPPGFAAAFPGEPPGPYARFGYDAMNDVLEALRRAGGRAPNRGAVIRAFRASPAAPLQLVD
jgi:hypothetical protein